MKLRLATVALKAVLASMLLALCFLATGCLRSSLAQCIRELKGDTNRLEVTVETLYGKGKILRNCYPPAP